MGHLIVIFLLSSFHWPEKNWEHSGREGIRKFPLFSKSGHFPLEKAAKFSLNFWPVRVHEKPAFRYVPGTFVANSSRAPKVALKKEKRLKRSITMGPKMITRTFLFYFRINSYLHNTSVTYGFLAGILLCNLGAYEGTFCEHANYTLLSGNEASNHTHISVTQ